MLTVSNYHYIRPVFEAKYPSIFGITPNMFDSQLKLLKNEGDFIHPNDLVSDFETVLKSNENYILITFDDGLKEQYDYAMPVLDQLDVPAIFFANSLNFDEKKITTVHKIHLLRSILSPATLLENLSEAKIQPLSLSEKAHAQSIYRYDDAESAALKYLLNFKLSFNIQEQVIQAIFSNYFDENEVLDSLYMTPKMIQDIAQQGYLGSHTHHHYPIGLLPADAMRFELQHSKSFFENLTNTTIKMVSYPYGSAEACTDEVAKIAKEVGYTLGFTTHRGTNSNLEDLLLLNRFDCNDVVGGKNYGK